ncbi:hypothetical protein [Azoarcus sp. KH32C]|uniref:hypothetical protein n=1 Tax=Azoarcus sp. KH32C TaxID=748247 RepID=UPI0002386DB7|nr:hypothetical protein [Azoarcus sp. KH32C]BAL24939.1 hypothetical protein AZKH_2633 [Azoarcus sp. KH32C]
MGTAKDFRSWDGTLKAAVFLAGTVVDDFGSARDAESGLSRSEAALRRMLARARKLKGGAP